MQLPEPRRIELPARSGPGGQSEGPIVLSTYVAGPANGPAVVLCHGFPELAYSWRHQISAAMVRATARQTSSPMD